MSNPEVDAGAQPCTTAATTITTTAATTTTTTTTTGFSACGAVFFEYFGFGLSVSLFQYSIRIHSHITDSLTI